MSDLTISGTTLVVAMNEGTFDIRAISSIRSRMNDEQQINIIPSFLKDSLNQNMNLQQLNYQSQKVVCLVGYHLISILYLTTQSGSLGKEGIFMLKHDFSINQKNLFAVIAGNILTYISIGQRSLFFNDIRKKDINYLISRSEFFVYDVMYLK